MFQSSAEALRPATNTTVGEPVPRHSTYILRPPPISTSRAVSWLTAGCPAAASKAAQTRTMRSADLFQVPGIDSSAKLRCIGQHFSDKERKKICTAQRRVGSGKRAGHSSQHDGIGVDCI